MGSEEDVLVEGRAAAETVARTPKRLTTEESIVDRIVKDATYCFISVLTLAIEK